MRPGPTFESRAITFRRFQLPLGLEVTLCGNHERYLGLRPKSAWAEISLRPGPTFESRAITFRRFELPLGREVTLCRNHARHLGRRPKSAWAGISLRPGPISRSRRLPLRNRRERQKRTWPNQRQNNTRRRARCLDTSCKVSVAEQRQTQLASTVATPAFHCHIQN